MSEKINNDPFLNAHKERLVDVDPQNMYVPKAGFWEQVGAGFGEGLDFTNEINIFFKFDSKTQSRLIRICVSMYI